jgi:dual specificity tyrosine-phosphorylation-regulated kinase 2/3/4
LDVEGRIRFFVPFVRRPCVMASSPRSGSPLSDSTRGKKRERPPALELSPAEVDAHLDEELVWDHPVRACPRPARPPSPVMEAHYGPWGVQPRVELNFSPTEEPPVVKHKEQPRSASAASSSLDPYYFTSRTPADSPAPPPLPDSDTLPRTPEMRSMLPPMTPGRNPAEIDRRGLVGVGELATPRWTRHEQVSVAQPDDTLQDLQEELNEAEPDVMGETGDGIEGERDADSPWTIEAVDEPKDEVCTSPVFMHRRTDTS